MKAWILQFVQNWVYVTDSAYCYTLPTARQVMRSPPSVPIHSIFRTDWPLALIFCMSVGGGSIPWLAGIETKGHRVRVRVKTRSVWPRSSIEDSFLVSVLKITTYVHFLRVFKINFIDNILNIGLLILTNWCFTVCIRTDQHWRNLIGSRGEIKNSPERGLRPSPDLDADVGWPWNSYRCEHVIDL